MRLKVNNFSINLSFPVLALCALVVISNQYTNYILCITAVVIHESGHLFIMFLFNRKPKALEVKLFNITIVQDSRYKTAFYKDVLITAAGPLFNILIYLLFFGFYPEFATVNLFIGLFNLLPAASLDGGQIIYLFLTKFFTAEKSAKIADIITIITAFPVFVSGILLLFNSKYNFSLLFIGIYLFLSLFFKNEKYL